MCGFNKGLYLISSKKGVELHSGVDDELKVHSVSSGK